MKRGFLIVVALVVLVCIGLGFSEIEGNQTISVNIHKGWNLVSSTVIEDGTKVCEPPEDCLIDTEEGKEVNGSCAEGNLECHPPKDFDTTCSVSSLKVLYGYDSLKEKYVKIEDRSRLGKGVSILGGVYNFYKREDEEYKDYITRSEANSVWLYSEENCKITKNLSRRGMSFTLKSLVEESSGEKIKIDPETHEKTKIQLNKSFPEGWNFFVILSDMANKSLEDIKGNCEIKEAYFWNSKKQEWKKINLKYKFSSSQVGNGFIFRISSNCLLKPKGFSVSVPSLPSSPTKEE